MIPKYEDLNEYVMVDEPERMRYKFPNGYGASVINSWGSYGLELAVLNSNGTIADDTHITDDVMAYLDVETLYETLLEIKALNAE